MSIKSEITRLQNAKTAIATAIKNKGVSVPTGTKLDEMSSLINNISTGTSTSDATAIASDVLQGKTAYNATGKITGTIASYSGEHTDGAEEGTAGIFPSGTLNVTQVGTYDVTNYASATFSVTTQTKSVTAGTSSTTVTPDSGKYLSSVTVNPTPTETKTVTPTASSQSITPTSGKYLSKVTVNAIPSSYIIPSGTKTITENGTHDVKSYASVSVNVASSGSGGGGEYEYVNVSIGKVAGISAISVYYSQVNTNNTITQGYKSCTSFYTDISRVLKGSIVMVYTTTSPINVTCTNCNLIRATDFTGSYRGIFIPTTSTSNVKIHISNSG